MAQTAATAAAVLAVAPESPSLSVGLSPRNRSALRTAYWHKAADDSDDDGSWFVNRHGVLFAVVNDVYFAVDTARVPELSDLPRGEYAHGKLPP